MTFDILQSGEYHVFGNKDVWVINRKYGDVPPPYIPVAQVGLFYGLPPGSERPVIVVEDVVRQVN